MPKDAQYYVEAANNSIRPFQAELDKRNLNVGLIDVGIAMDAGEFEFATRFLFTICNEAGYAGLNFPRPIWLGIRESARLLGLDDVQMGCDEHLREL